ncbi:MULTISPECIES: hypothetical protein [unclassified Streptomyces]|uniref:hypothetical protein n=1 Tax=unclassified Streptomyces TaxID=2593676 RepID=UPI0036640374
MAAHGDAGQGEQARGLFRTDPAPHRLTTGDMCRVGIPPTLVHVIDVAHYSPPQETGRLPRPSRLVVVLPAGLSFDSRLEEQGESFDPDDDIPLAFDLTFRPYAFLEPGDEVADKAGRAWRFDGPWDWHPFDGAEPHEPAWPLSLLTRVNATTAEVQIASRMRRIAAPTRRNAPAGAPSPGRTLRRALAPHFCRRREFR